MSPALRTLASVLGALVLAACGSAPRPAPVSARGDAAPAAKPAPAASAAREADWRPREYVVKKGDTLFGIALDHGLDYRELAQWNGIADPNLIRVGQRLSLQAPEAAAAAAKPATAAPPAEPAAPELKSSPKAVKLPYTAQALQQAAGTPGEAVAAPAVAAVPPPQPAAGLPGGGAKALPETRPAGEPEAGELGWAWPAQGRVLEAFSERAKGIDIDGQAGQPVYASAPGKVVYSGTGLRGYGKLIIIKHNKDYLSAYAHNQRLLVKEGEAVTRGQKIAEMGSTDAERVKLHFEIRRLGKPVDPLKYLPADRPS